MLFRVEVEAEVRLQVDELMREELKNLKLVRILHCWFKVAHSISSSRKAIDKDKGKGKGKGKGKKKGKKGKVCCA